MYDIYLEILLLKLYFTLSTSAPCPLESGWIIKSPSKYVPVVVYI